MASFDYIIQLTGDCQNNGGGAISITLTGGTPPYTVDWVEPNLGSDDLLITLPSVRTGLTVNTYAVRVNDSTLPVNGEFYINIPISNGVCTSISSVSNSYCNGNNGSVTATTNSSFSSTNFYLYSGGGQYVTSAITNTSNVIFNSLVPGVYYIISEDLGGCTGRTANFIVEDSNDFDFGLYVVPNTSCGGSPTGKIFITGVTGNSPYTFQWSNGSIDNSITGLTSGNYSVSVTDSTGCVKTKSADIVDVPPIGFGLFTPVPPTCFFNNGSLTLTITGGTEPFYYSASTGYFEISYSRNFTLSYLWAGDYSILVTDSGLCSIIASTRLESPEGFSSVNIVGQNSVCSSNNGQIIINVEGGISPYTYILIDPSGNTNSVSTILSTQTFSNLHSGTYTVIVQSSPDGENPLSYCSRTKEITILAEDKFTISTSITGTTCGNNNGIVQVIATTGGTLPYIYSINGVNDVDGIFTNLSAGQHTITVTDSEGCVQTKNVVVPSSNGLDFSLYSTSCGSGNEGTITAFVGSGEPPFTYTWSNNVSGNPQQIQITGLTAGTYSLTIIDNNGCSKQRNATISCNQSMASYQTYVMASEVFSIQSPTKQGTIQMLNEGYFDLTSGNTSCSLISADYAVGITINPSGTTVQSTIPFTSTTLNQVPSDNLYYDTVKNLLLTIPGIGSVDVDSINNQLTIQTIPEDTTLNGQEIIIDLIINYNIMCVS